MVLYFDVILLNYNLVSAIIISTFLMIVYLQYVSAEWKIPSITDVNLNFTTYENKFLKIDYPENWIFAETTDSVTFAPDRDSIDKIKINVN